MTQERSTLSRQLALLDALPAYPKKISIQQLHNKMSNLGYVVTQRTIQRDLIHLSTCATGILSDEAKPAGWCRLADDKPSYRHNTLAGYTPIPPVQSIHARPTMPSPSDNDLKRLKDLLKLNTAHIAQHFHPDNFIGRKWLLDRIDHWLNNKRSPLLWLHGAPGIGKTAFVSWLTQQRANYIAGIFFCQYQYQKSSEEYAVDAICSLAFQLARRLPIFRQHLIMRLTSINSALQELTVHDLFGNLILTPLIDADRDNGLNAKVMLVIDGLDEICPKSASNALLNVIVDNAKDLPTSITLLLSSRSEIALRCRLAGFDSIEILAADQDNEQDLREWLNQKLPETMAKEHRFSVMDRLICSSDGLFLYLRLLGQDLTDYWLAPERIPASLNNYFMGCFTRYFPDMDSYSVNQRPILELLVSALEPISQTTMCSVLRWDEYRYDQAIASFGALFIDNAQPEKILTPFHKALIDWLTDQGRAGLYRVSQQQGNQHMAEGLWSLYQQGSENLPHYGLHYLPKHLMLAGRHDDVRTCLLDFKFILARSNELAIITNIHNLRNEYRDANYRTSVDEALWAWELFFRANGQYLQKGHQYWPTSKILLQRAIEQPKGSPIRAAAEHYISDHQGYWLRSIHEHQISPCLILDDHSVNPLLVDNKYIVGLSTTGHLSVWDSMTGQCLFRLPTHRPVIGSGDMMALDSRHILYWSSNPDAFLQIFDITQGECVFSISGQGRMSSVHLLANGYFLASFENHLGIWNCEGQQQSLLNSTAKIKNIWPLANGNFMLQNVCLTGNDDQLLSIRNGETAELISTLNCCELFTPELMYSSIQIIELGDSEILIWQEEGEKFQIWDYQSGRLLATGSKGERLPLVIIKGAPVRIMVAHNIPLTDMFSLLNIRTWLWDNQRLILEHNIDLTPSSIVALDFDDQAACVTDCQLFEDGRVLLPSPLTLWSGLTGEKLADLKGSWSLLAECGFYRRFADGRLLTWDEKPLVHCPGGTRLFLWDRNGKLIQEVPVDSMFRDIKILENGNFVTQSFDDHLYLWEGESGLLLQVFTGMGQIDAIKSLPSDQLLTLDQQKTLCLRPISRGAQGIIENRHASNSQIKTLRFKDRILSFSLDSFPPRLWDANSGDLITVLPAFDNAIGAHLGGIIPLSGERFLTWGHGTSMHIFDSQQGICLASMQNHHKPLLSISKAWALKNDLIMCLLWDKNLYLWDLETNDFKIRKTVATDVTGAQPLSAERVAYWSYNGTLQIWNVAEERIDFEFAGPRTHIENIQLVLNHILLICSSKESQLVDTKSGNSYWMASGAKHIIETADQCLVIWSNETLEVRDSNKLGVIQFSLKLKKPERFVFVTQLPTGNLLTQTRNNQVTLWTTWDIQTGAQIGSTVLPNHYDTCQEAIMKGQTVLLRMTAEPMNKRFHVILEWRDPDNLQFIEIHNDEDQDNNLAFKLYQSLSLSKGNWIFWGSKTGSPVGTTRTGKNSVYCEWHGEPMTELIEMTDEGRLLGFNRKPIILQLFNGSRPATFQSKGYE